jgi:hypothetical protein
MDLSRDRLILEAVDMGSVAIIYIPCFVKIGSGIQKLIGEIHRHHGDRIS